MQEAFEPSRAPVAPISVGLFETDTEGRFLVCNEACAELVGMTAEQASGAGWHEALDPYERGPVLASWRRAAADGGAWSEELRLQRADGSTRWVQISAVPTDAGTATGAAFAATMVDVTDRVRAEVQSGALRRVAKAIAAPNADPAWVFDLVAEELANLLDADRVAISRFEVGGAPLVGQWVSTPELRVPLGATVPLEGTGATAEVLRTELPVRRARTNGRVTAAAPIRVGGALWGAVGAVSLDGGSLPEGAEYRLAEFADLLEAGIVNAEGRRALEEQATRDPLTGLWNHRAFHERLGEEVARAGRGGERLGLVLIDLDHFKAVNDTYGHQVGDEVLREAAARLSERARAGDVAARVGGEELAWLMPGSDVQGALAAAESLREALEGGEFPGVGTQTASFGVAELPADGSAEEIYRQADVGLYYAKSTGRNRCAAYSFEVAEDLVARQAEARGGQSPTLAGLRALAWTADSRPASLAGHSVRVSDIAVRLATAMGWAVEQAAALREATLVHDVGRVSLPEEIASVEGHLDAAQLATAREQVRLGAAAVEELLNEEQLSWVLHHHERFDGSGYPDGLVGDETPMGARLIAVAEAWDLLTTTCDGGAAPRHEDALAEMLGCAGTQFCPEVVAALDLLHRASALQVAPRTRADAATRA